MSLHRGKWLALAAFIGIVVLVAGGLAWVTRAALQLEQSELQLKHSDTLRLALWRLDSRVFPAIAREDSRPVAHYDPFYPPMPALNRMGQAVPTGSVLVPSPLLSAELPAWMPLHFSVDSVAGWRSPQVLDSRLTKQIAQMSIGIDTPNATATRAELLESLKKQFPSTKVIGTKDQPAEVAKQIMSQRSGEWQENAAGNGGQQARGGNANPSPGGRIQQEFDKLANQQQSLRNENRNPNSDNGNIFNFMPESGRYFAEKGVEWKFAATCVAVNNLEPMAPRWMPAEDGTPHLMLLRPLDAKGITAVQGVLLDWPKLKKVLLEEISDLLPDADLQPSTSDDGVRLAALPVRLVTPGPVLEWNSMQTPMRLGLGLAWLAAMLALGVVGLGGWSLLDLSERRFRFVTAVTHELRTPLTTLRLYTDMLTSGLVKDEKTRDEYLGTLNVEAERLHRLIGNVLDFARLERQSPNINRRPLDVRDLGDALHRDWAGHCQTSGKQLVIEIADDCPPQVTTDPDLVRQILGNLIENACKYSREAADPRIWLRASREGRWLTLSVEDRGPGVTRRESRSVFRPFTRGKRAPENVGGVGLGLALAARWAGLLGGQLGLAECADGACFRLRIPNE